MNKGNRNHINLSKTILILIAINFTLYNSSSQEQVNTATDKLAILSEKMLSKNIEDVRVLLQAGADINVRNKFNVTPLFMASQEGYRTRRTVADSRN